jgi:hypothetical protein
MVLVARNPLNGQLRGAVKGSGKWSFGDNGIPKCKFCGKNAQSKPVVDCPFPEHLIHYRKGHERREHQNINTLRRLGEKCACCGFSDFTKKVLGRRFLQVDHVNGGGSHTGSNRESRDNLALIRKDPSGLRLLCGACNVSMEPGRDVCEYHRWQRTS